MSPRIPREDVECCYCTNVCKIRQVDLIEAESIAEVICRECLRNMIRRYRRTGILGPPCWSDPSPASRKVTR